MTSLNKAILLLALYFTGETFAGRSRSANPSRAFQRCPTLRHPNHPQCSIETSCDNGHCGITLDRCGAEYINAHYGQKIDLNLFEEGQQSNIEENNYTEMYYNPTTQLYEPVTGDHVRDENKYHYIQAFNKEQKESTNSVDDDEDGIASINSPPRGSNYNAMHVHRVGCTRCGRPWPCWYNQDCSKLLQGAYCYQADKRYPGICKWNYSVLTNNGHKLVSVCCEQ